MNKIRDIGISKLGLAFFKLIKLNSIKLLINIRIKILKIKFIILVLNNWD